VPLMSQNPMLQQSPAMLKTLTENLGQMGINEVPRAADGSIDLHALQALTAQPISQTMVAKLTDTSNMEKLLGDPKSGYAPGAFAADLKKNIGILRASGMGQDADALEAAYFNPDGSLTDAFKQKVVGPMVQAEMDNLHSLGIFRTDEVQLKQQLLQEHLKEFDANYGLRKARLSLDEQKAADMANYHQGQLADASQKLQATWARITNQQNQFQQNYGLRYNTYVMGAYKSLLNGAQRQFTEAQSRLTSTTSAINNMIANNQQGRPEFTALVNQAAGLKQFLDTNGPVLQSEIANSQNAVAGAVSQMTGNPTTTVQPQPGTRKPPADIPTGMEDYFKTASPEERKATLSDPRTKPDVKAYLEATYGSTGGAAPASPFTR